MGSSGTEPGDSEPRPPIVYSAVTLETRDGEQDSHVLLVAKNTPLQRGAERGGASAVLFRRRYGAAASQLCAGAASGVSTTGRTKLKPLPFPL